MSNDQDNTFLKPEEKEFQKTYQRSLWLIEHRELFKKIGLFVFGFFDLILLLYAGWIFFDAFVLSKDSEQAVVSNLVINGQSELYDFSQSVAAKPLTAGDVLVTSAGNSGFDLSVLLSNSNDDWYATFDYAFILKDGETIIQQGFILPREERPLVLFGATDIKPTDPKLSLSNLQWQRVDPHAISDYGSWSADRLSLIFSNSNFTRQDDNNADLSFTVKNSSAYNYHDPSFVVLLWRGTTLVGVMRLTTDELLGEEEKKLTARWLGPVPSVTKIVIYPEINIFDSEVYLAPTGTNPSDARTKVNVK